MSGLKANILCKVKDSNSVNTSDDDLSCAAHNSKGIYYALYSAQNSSANNACSIANVSKDA